MYDDMRAGLMPYGFGYGYGMGRENRPANNNMDWIRVNSINDVNNVQVQPGGKAWIMLTNDPVFVVKSADSMGMTTTEAYKFEKYEPEDTTPQYVTKSEFMEFVNEIKKAIGGKKDESAD